MAKVIILVVALLAGIAMAAYADIPTADELADAPEANVEKLGVVQRLGRISASQLSPGTDEYPPRLIMALWSMADRRWFETYVIDLTDGTFRKVEAEGFDQDCPRWPSVMGPDGRIYFSCMRGALAIYDPRDDSFDMVRPIERSGWLRGLAIGGDGAIYCSDYPTGSAARYDTETGEIENYGPQGGPYQINNVYGYSVGSCGEWVYTAVGKIPWHVVALNRATGEQTVLFEYDQADFPGVVQRGKDVYLSATIVDQDAGETRTEYYHLVDGAAEPVDAIPPAPREPRPWDGIAQPEIHTGPRGLAIEDDGAIVWFRTPDAREEAGNGAGDPSEENGWTRVALPIEGEPYNITRIAPMDDGRVVLSTGAYGNVFTYDPEEDKLEEVGNPANRNVYCLLHHDGRIYFGGYSNAFLGVFDNGDSRFLYDWNRMLGSKRSLDLFAAADGNIYLANQSEREFVGGSLAWWNPETEEPGGIRFPNDQCHYLAGAIDGRYVVVSTRVVVDPAAPDREIGSAGRLIVFDTEAGEVVREIEPLPDQRMVGNAGGAAGMIAEAAPGKILGLTSENNQPVMYLVDVLEGERIERVELPEQARGDLQYGPDGKLYTFLGETLVRIDPETLAITPVCRAAPGRIAFSGGDIYLAGEAELRVIRRVAE